MACGHKGGKAVGHTGIARVCARCRRQFDTYQLKTARQRWNFDFWSARSISSASRQLIEAVEHEVRLHGLCAEDCYSNHFIALSPRGNWPSSVCSSGPQLASAFCTLGKQSAPRIAASEEGVPALFGVVSLDLINAFGNEPHKRT